MIPSVWPVYPHSQRTGLATPMRAFPGTTGGFTPANNQEGRRLLHLRLLIQIMNQRTGTCRLLRISMLPGRHTQPCPEVIRRAAARLTTERIRSREYAVEERRTRPGLLGMNMSR